MNDFDGYEFAAGDLTGFRHFVVDQFGRLRAISAEYVWRPGENVAACDKTPKDHTDDCRKRQALYMEQRGMVVEISAGPIALSSFLPGFPCGCPWTKEPALHKPDCTCGFYAYSGTANSPSNSHIDGVVPAVIRAYGKTVIGTKGFRAEKAEIVAVTLPVKTTGSRLWWVPVVFALFTVAVRRRPKIISDGRAAVLRRNYPDVQQYPTVKAMLTAHPLSLTEKVTPDTDPDFWTRP